MAVISSPRNPRIQRVRKLHRRTFRDREGAFLLEGPVVIAEALAAGTQLQEVLIEAGFIEADAAAGDLSAAARARGVPVVEVSRGVMESASGTATPQGALAVATIPRATLDEVGPDAALVLVLAGVSDPGNAGTLLRSALAAGVDAVVFLEGSVDPFAPKTVRASTGAVLGVPVVRNLDRAGCVATLKELGFRLVGSAAEGPVLLEDADLDGPVAVFLGNEAAGLPDDVRADLDEVVAIPMPGPVESLNAAVAGSIILFEIVRRERVRAHR